MTTFTVGYLVASLASGKPSAVIGASPEACIQFTPGMICDRGEVTVGSTESVLRTCMSKFRDHIARMLPILPNKG